MGMNRTTSAEEIAFIESIDARFPYRDESARREVVRIGAALSDNAALMVAYELASAPSEVSTQLRLDLLDDLVAQRPSALVVAAAPVVRALILDERPSTEAADGLLRECRATPGVFNALNILAECSPAHAEHAEAIRVRS